MDAAIEEFTAGPWGAAARDRASAGGLCQRGSLALLHHLEKRGCAEGVNVWRFDDPVAGAGRGEYTNHTVLEVDGMIIDLTGAQFDDVPGVHRGSLDDELQRWRSARQFDPDDPPSDLRPDPFLRTTGIVPNWRDLLDAGPPGDIPGWLYNRRLFSEESPWYRDDGSEVP